MQNIEVAINIYLKTEQGETHGGGGGGEVLELRLPTEDESDYRCLGFIDPYGDGFQPSPVRGIRL